MLRGLEIDLEVLDLMRLTRVGGEIEKWQSASMQVCDNALMRHEHECEHWHMHIMRCDIEMRVYVL